jgi:hypothetical protein
MVEQQNAADKALQQEISEIYRSVAKSLEPSHIEILQLKLKKREECSYQNDSLDKIQECIKPYMICEEDHQAAAVNALNKSYYQLNQCIANTNKAKSNYNERVDACKKQYEQNLMELDKLNVIHLRQLKKLM